MEIDFVDEEEGLDLLEAREMFLNYNIKGLGPDDFVIIKKSLINSKSPNYKYFCHSVSGLMVDSLESFLDYYLKLEQLQNHQNKIQTQKYKFEGGQFRCFNSFSNEELLITVDCELNITTNITELIDQNFDNFLYSSILRYHRPTFPIICATFGCVNPYYLKYLNCYQPRNLNYEEIEYLTKKHPISHEFYFSIAKIVSLTLNSKQFSQYLHQIEHTHPMVLSYIHQIIPKNREISTALYFFIEHHLDFFCDDLNSAITLVIHFCDCQNIEKCIKFVPLLHSNLWNDPRCGICLGRICTHNSKFSDAFGYFNLASFRINNNLNHLNHNDLHESNLNENNINESYINENNININYLSESCWNDKVSKEELKLCKTQLNGIFSDFINAIIEMYLKINNEELFSELIDDFSRKHRLYRHYSQINKTSEYYSDYSENNNDMNIENRKINIELDYRYGKSNTENENSDLFEYYENDNQEAIFLYDPGIESVPQIDNELENMPFSSTFNEALNNVKGIFNQYKKLKNRRANLNQDHVGNLIVAYRVKDGELMNRIFKTVQQSRTVTIADFVIMLKGVVVGLIQITNTLLETYPYNSNHAQKTVLDYTRKLVKQLDELPQLNDNP